MKKTALQAISILVTTQLALNLASCSDQNDLDSNSNQKSLREAGKVKPATIGEKSIADSNPESEPEDNEGQTGMASTALVLEDWPDFSKTETLQAVLGEARGVENLQEKGPDGLVRTSEGLPFTGWKKGARPAGELAILERYEDGQLVGQTFFWPNGQKKKEGRFLNDAPDGTWIEWNEAGSESSRVNFSNGAIVE